MRVRRRTAVAVLGAVLATTGTVGAVGVAPAQAAATDQSYWVPVGKQLSLRDRGNRSTVALPTNDAVSRWRLSVREGKTVVEKYTDRWRRFRPFGKEFLDGEGEFFADGPITLWTPSGSRTYR